MRIIRSLFLIVLLLVLIGLALANRQMVTLAALPPDWVPGLTVTVTVPLFLVIILAIMAGIVIGLIWEWLREAGLRAESGRRQAEIDRLQREVGGLRKTHAAPEDEIIAILDAPRPAPKPAPVAATLPATAPTASPSPAGAGVPAPR